MVASQRSSAAQGAVRKFQSPSLRGSGRFGRRRADPSRGGGGFQSPSLRGSGRFRRRRRPAAASGARFNPLHCGAVVASSNRSRRWPGSGPSFNPLHCGAVVASGTLAVAIALAARFNPLHCGAVVASSGDGVQHEDTEWCFNPLHCGAVVASPGLRGQDQDQDQVSIPFIAGQWSLLIDPFTFAIVRDSSFNPLHCGAVVASRSRSVIGGASVQGVSIPFIAGQWSLLAARRSLPAPNVFVSIPFIAGQWSLQARKEAEARAARMFQSPSLRGSGRFVWQGGGASGSPPGFNPLHCGAVVASRGAGALRRQRRVSIPFIAGQWSLLPPPSPHGGRRNGRFNPLHCGAVVASPCRACA